jgi:hypothetical protein
MIDAIKGWKEVKRNGLKPRRRESEERKKEPGKDFIIGKRIRLREKKKRIAE